MKASEEPATSVVLTVDPGRYSIMEPQARGQGL